MFYAESGSADDVTASLRAALEAWQQAPAGSRLFIVRSHVSRTETAAWESAFSTLNVHPRPHDVGDPQPLLVLK